MTPERAHHLGRLIEAMADGKAIQWRSVHNMDGAWNDLSLGENQEALFYRYNDYRIKPEPEKLYWRVYLTNIDLPVILYTKNKSGYDTKEKWNTVATACKGFKCWLSDWQEKEL